MTVKEEETEVEDGEKMEGEGESEFFLRINPVIQQLRKNSIQTIRDISDVLQHIVKNVSEKPVRNIVSRTGPHLITMST
jgi:hypothetical protein